MRKIKRTEVTALKERLRKEQGGVCPLCLEKLPKELKDIALDHNHITGECRGVLHLGCNRVEGIVFNAVARWGKQGKVYDNVAPFLRRLLHYIETREGTGLIYHLHKTPEQRAEAQRLRARKAYAKAKAAERLRKSK